MTEVGLALDGHRPELLALLRALRCALRCAPKVSTIVVEHRDRFARHVGDASFAEFRRQFEDTTA